MTDKMKFLTRDDILSAVDVQTEMVEVPEWGGKVLIKGLTAKERDAYEKMVLDRRGKNTRVNFEDMRAKLSVWCIRDGEGNRLFSDDDFSELSKKSASAVQRVFNVASRLSGLSSEDVEELTKNSERATDDSISG